MVEAVENRAINGRRICRFGSSTRISSGVVYNLRLCRIRSRRSTIAEIAFCSVHLGVAGNSLDDRPPPGNLLEKQDLVAGARLSAPLVNLEHRLGVPRIESDLRELSGAPGTREPQGKTDPPVNAGEIVRNVVLGHVAQSVVRHQLQIAVRDKGDRNPVSEFLEAWSFRTLASEGKNCRRIDPRLVSPDRFACD